MGGQGLFKLRKLENVAQTVRNAPSSPIHPLSFACWSGSCWLSSERRPRHDGAFSSLFIQFQVGGPVRQ